MVQFVIKSKKYGEKICYFDESCYNVVGLHVWCVVPNRQTFYAMTRIKVAYGKYKTIRMHQLFVDSSCIDHVDGNGLNNTLVNLRPATSQQNNFNVGLTKRNKSGYKGVYRHRNKFIASIRKSGKLIHGGTFSTPEEAARRYNELAHDHHGEFAWLNIV